MKLTKANKSDFLLLGGDLYDKNEPDCKTHEETIKIFEKVCLSRAFFLIFGLVCVWSQQAKV